MDAMVVINLSKITLLQNLAENIRLVIPHKVFEEAVENSLGRYNDALITDGLIKDGNIRVLDVNEDRLKRMERFGLIGGEAEVVALYLDGKYDAVASDDDAVRANRAPLDKSTIIRRFIAEGLREYKRERAARHYKEQRVSISGAAELAGLSVREMIDYLIRGGYKSRYSYEDLKKEMNLLGTIKNNE